MRLAGTCSIDADPTHAIHESIDGMRCLPGRKGLLEQGKNQSVSGFFWQAPETGQHFACIVRPCFLSHVRALKTNSAGFSEIQEAMANNSVNPLVSERLCVYG